MNNNDNFYLIIPVGLEQLAADELTEKWQYVSQTPSAPNFTLTKGGIELSCPLHNGFLLNQLLKIPTRILLRVDSFKCRDFPKLYKKLQKIEWRKFLAGQTVEIKSSAYNSRLFDSRKIEKTAIDALDRYFIANAPKKKQMEHAAQAPTTAIFLRFENDLCTVSIDTSGEKLYRRAYRKYVGEAPIRENIATGLLLKLKEHLSDQQNYNLIDPMCGSATFLLESAMYNTPSTERQFAWPYFPIAKQVPTPKEISNAGPLFAGHQGFDKDEKVLAAALDNINLASCEISTRQMDLFSNGKYDKQDVGKNIVIINPPYGKRIAIDEDNLDQFFKKLIDQILKKFTPEAVGIIVPEGVKLEHPKIVNKMKFKNGGLDVCFYILVVV